ncbi:hypothetical protein GCM10023196_033140 [Actinoallomurus vinaceus]|uniref:Uncharacterized protein n=1 Tax=Actinoallomurus vinaceus TaxID=1080074 RepID=A0ABP8UCR5_9ACTN
MSIIIDFVRRRPGNVLPNGDAVDLSTASSVRLLYSLFMGDIVVRSAAVDFTTKFGSVSMLSVLTGLPEAISDALISGKGKFQFFEQDEHLVMRRRGDCVEIRCSYAEGVMRVANEELVIAILQFSKQSVVDTVEQYPEILDNPNFLKLTFLR